MKIYKKKKKALIFGVTGQDGSYLSRLLLKKGYIVYGIKRKSSSINTSRIDDIYEDINEAKNFILLYGDLSDSSSVNKLIISIMPDEIYNLAAQSHVAVSFELPEYTSDINALGVLRILETIKNIQHQKKIKFYQAGTSEMFGSSLPPQNENTIFSPQSPYAISKVFAHQMTINYRESYKMFACNGILFNHESPVRGETFVTQKIIQGLWKIKNNQLKTLYLGNLYAKRDWGHAEDYVLAIWKIMQAKKPEDYVVSTGSQITVKDFIQKVATKLSLELNWVGQGLNERALYKNKVIIKVSKRYFRPLEVNSLMGDSTKILTKLGWKPRYKIEALIDDMINKLNETK